MPPRERPRFEAAARLPLPTMWKLPGGLPAVLPGASGGCGHLHSLRSRFSYGQESCRRSPTAAIRRFFALSRAIRRVVAEHAAAIPGHSARHAGIRSGRGREGLLRYRRFLDDECRTDSRARYDEHVTFRDILDCRTDPQVIADSDLRHIHVHHYDSALGQLRREPLFRGRLARAARSVLTVEAKPELGGDSWNCHVAFHCALGVPIERRDRRSPE